MAKRKNSKPASEHSLILKSAESLGRMIGALQRQLEAARKASPPAARKKKRPAKKRKPTARKG
jgi:hypothetical protein